MLHCYADASMDESAHILSCGYVITKTRRGDESLVDAGCRILNTKTANPRIDWCIQRGEYRSLITGVRAALDYTNEPIMVYSDNEAVVDAITDGYNPWEPYFHHALRSFIERFDDWHITEIDRERNELAHEQARIGLKLGRDIVEGTL